MDDKLVNGIDAQDILDDTESLVDKLIKRKRKWTGVAVFWFIIWLLIIMYMFWLGFFHQDTVKPPQPTPVTTEESTPTPEPDPTPTSESIEVYEYNLKSVGVSTPFTDSLISQGSNNPTFTHVYGSDEGITGSTGGAYYVNDSAITAYDSSFSVLWELNKGDDCFTAERTDSSKRFKSDAKSLLDVTGTTNLGAIYGNAVEGYENVRPLICITEGNVSKGADGIAVILPSSTTEEQIANGVSTFLEKVNALNLQLTISDAGSVWNMDDKTIDDFKSMLGDSFSSTGYRISSTGNDDISILGSADGGISIKSLADLEAGNKIVYITLERFYLMDDMHSHTSAAYYSKYLQGDDIELFSDLDTFHKAVSDEYNN